MSELQSYLSDFDTYEIFNSIPTRELSRIKSIGYSGRVYVIDPENELYLGLQFTSKGGITQYCKVKEFKFSLGDWIYNKFIGRGKTCFGVIVRYGLEGIVNDEINRMNDEIKLESRDPAYMPKLDWQESPSNGNYLFARIN